jgi:hypothetical protein
MKTALTLTTLNTLLAYASFHIIITMQIQNGGSRITCTSLPTAVVQANESPAGSVSAPIGHALPYTLRKFALQALFARLGLTSFHLSGTGVNVSELAVRNATGENDKITRQRSHSGNYF